MVREPDVSKLPKWAQDHIASLENKLDKDVAYWRNKVVEAETGDTNTFLGDHPNDIGLPRDCRIVFRLGENRIDARIKDDHLYVYGTECLEVQPQSGNVVKVRTGRFW